MNIVYLYGFDNGINYTEHWGIASDLEKAKELVTRRAALEDNSDSLFICRCEINGDSIMTTHIFQKNEWKNL